MPKSSTVKPSARPVKGHSAGTINRLAGELHANLVNPDGNDSRAINTMRDLCFELNDLLSKLGER